jgi:phage-related tail fiber protein
VAVRKPLVLVAGAVSELPAADTIAAGGSPTVPQDFKDSVDCATTANITLSGEQTIDGVATAASRVLVKDQTTGSQNGLYLTAAGAWSRTTDADLSAEVTSGVQVYVEGGTVNGGQTFVLVTGDPITLDTTALTFTAAPIAPAAFVGKTVAGTTYTHVRTDSGKRLNLTNAAAKTITVAPQSSVASPVNTEIELFNAGAGTATLAPGSGVTINAPGGLLSLLQFQTGKL